MQCQKILTKGVAAAAVAMGMLSAGSVQAASVALLPGAQTVTEGESFTLTLFGDFADGTLGGGMDVFFDAALLAFESFEFDASLADDPGLRRDPDVLGGELNGIAFANFDGLSGVFDIGQITFTAIAPGVANLFIGANEGGPPDNPGPFVDAGGFLLDVDFGSADVEIQPIPLPGGLWLLASGLVALLGTRRRGNA